MSDDTGSQPPHPHVDPQRVRPDNAFDTSDGATGQGYRREREEAELRKNPSGHPLTGDAAHNPTPEEAAGRDLPPDAGMRGYVDPATGEVRGSGSGAGGGNPGEDYDVGTTGAAPAKA